MKAFLISPTAPSAQRGYSQGARLDVEPAGGALGLLGGASAPPAVDEKLHSIRKPPGLGRDGASAPEGIAEDPRPPSALGFREDVSDGGRTLQDLDICPPADRAQMGESPRLSELHASEISASRRRLQLKSSALD